MGKSHPYEGAFLSTTNELPDVLTTTTIETSLPVSTTVISPIVTPAHVVKRAGSPVPLKNEGVALWHGEITVGNPAQKFTVDFDTGSSDLFLASPDCSSNCEGHERYNAGPSGQALSKTFQLGYGDGSSVSGNQYQDTVCIAGMTVSVHNCAKFEFEPVVYSYPSIGCEPNSWFRHRLFVGLCQRELCSRWFTRNGFPVHFQLSVRSFVPESRRAGSS